EAPRGRVFRPRFHESHGSGLLGAESTLLEHRRSGAVARATEKEEMAAIREEFRPSVAGLSCGPIPKARRHGLPPCSPSGHYGIRWPEIVEDGPSLAPAAVGSVRFADKLCGTAGGRHLLQLALGKERQILAVGRPERPRGALGSGKRIRIERAQRADPDGTL